MAELFTEEDVRKIKDCIVNPSTRLPKRDGENFPTWAARAILSALAEDGRLKPAAPPYFPGMTIGQIISSRGFVPIEDEPTESGGALPSDAPALGDYVIVEWNQASHQPRAAFEDFYDQEQAVDLAREQLRRNRAVGRREGYSVHEVGYAVWSHDDDPVVPADSESHP